MRAVFYFSIMMIAGGEALACDQGAASNVQNNLRELAAVSEKEDRVTYNWGPTWDNQSEERRLRLVRAAADADACLRGRAREMRFYANGKLVGVASPTFGVRLVR